MGDDMGFLMLERIVFLFSLRPILLGFAGMLISGFSFPIAGVIVLRNGLVPLRFMLMHGVLLAGIVSVAFAFPLLPAAIVVNLLLVLLIAAIGKRSWNFSLSSSAVMVLTMSGASLLSHLLDVPAKDTLDLLWGSPFALTVSDLAVLLAIAFAIIGYCLTQYRKIVALFFDTDVAVSVGVDVRLHQAIMIGLSALVIAVSMKIMGALLLDSLLILPVLSSSGSARSVKSLFIRSSVCGFAVSMVGYPIAVLADLPVSGVVSALAVMAYGAMFLCGKLRAVSKERAT